MTILAASSVLSAPLGGDVIIDPPIGIDPVIVQVHTDEIMENVSYNGLVYSISKYGSCSRPPAPEGVAVNSTCTFHIVLPKGVSLTAIPSQSDIATTELSISDVGIAAMEQTETVPDTGTGAVIIGDLENQTGVVADTTDYAITTITTNEDLVDLVDTIDYSFSLEVPYSQQGKFNLTIQTSEGEITFDPYIDKCFATSGSGEYHLVNDIDAIASGSGICIDIHDDNVAIIGHGQSVAGDGGGTNTFGIYSSSRSDIVVDEVRVYGFKEALHFDRMKGYLNLTRVQSETSPGHIFGTHIDNCENLFISNSIFQDNYGMDALHINDCSGTYQIVDNSSFLSVKGLVSFYNGKSNTNMSIINNHFSGSANSLLYTLSNDPALYIANNRFDVTSGMAVESKSEQGLFVNNSIYGFATDYFVWMDTELKFVNNTVIGTVPDNQAGILDETAGVEHYGNYVNITFDDNGIAYRHPSGDTNTYVNNTFIGNGPHSTGFSNGGASTLIYHNLLCGAITALDSSSGKWGYAHEGNVWGDICGNPCSDPLACFEYASPSATPSTYSPDYYVSPNRYPNNGGTASGLVDRYPLVREIPEVSNATYCTNPFASVSGQMITKTTFTEYICCSCSMGGNSIPCGGFTAYLNFTDGTGNKSQVNQTNVSANFTGLQDGQTYVRQGICRTTTGATLATPIRTIWVRNVETATSVVPPSDSIMMPLLVYLIIFIVAGYLVYQTFKKNGGE